MKNENNYTYDELDIDRLYETLVMVRDVFMEFEAPDYSEEGIDEFLRFLEPDDILDKLIKNDLRIWTCDFEGETVGMIAACDNHINLLFVKGTHHRKGIARQLVDIMIGFYKPAELTVNSSPYAVEAYKRMGFIETDVEQIVSGIRFIPMKRYFV